MEDVLIDRIDRSIQWLENNHEEKTYVAQMACIACLSQYHFSRVFYSATGMSPAQYKRRRLLTLAAEKLDQSKQNILDIALGAGYESQEAFTRAFKKMFQISPGAVKQSTVDLSPYYQDKISKRGLYHIQKGGLSLEPKIRQCDTKVITGITRSIPFNGTEEANEIWKRYFECYSHNIDKCYYGVCQGTINNHSLSPEIQYMVGVEYDKSKEANNTDLTNAVIEPGNYAVFTHEGELDDIWTTISYIWQIWAMRNEYTLRAAPDFEFYDHLFDQESLEGRIEIWVPIE